jgi:hypothetical protein
MRRILIIAALFCFAGSCANRSNNDPHAPLTNETAAADKSPSETGEQTADKAKKPADTVRSNEKTTREECLKIDSGDLLLLKSQTLPTDFKPYEGACFVTMHDAEYDDPPLGSVISIYKDGAQVYTFDSSFNPDAATCWVEAVAFEDLDGDGLKDVVVAGKCGVKSGDLSANEVFINRGDGEFHTDTAANDELEEFDTIREISDFVKKNKELFVPGN